MPAAFAWRVYTPGNPSSTNTEPINPIRLPITATGPARAWGKGPLMNALET